MLGCLRLEAHNTRPEIALGVDNWQFLDGAAAELEASSGQGPGGFGSSSGIVEKTPDEA